MHVHVYVSLTTASRRSALLTRTCASTHCIYTYTYSCMCIYIDRSRLRHVAQLRLHVSVLLLSVYIHNHIHTLIVHKHTYIYILTTTYLCFFSLCTYIITYTHSTHTKHTSLVAWVRRGCTRFRITCLLCLEEKYFPPTIGYTGPAWPTYKIKFCTFFLYFVIILMHICRNPRTYVLPTRRVNKQIHIHDSVPVLLLSVYILNHIHTLNTHTHTYTYSRPTHTHIHIHTHECVTSLSRSYTNLCFIAVCVCIYT